jgi:hypothetical protein
MSGGAFDYNDFHIYNIAESIQSELDRQGDEREKSYFGDVQENHPIFPPEIQQRFKEAVRFLKIASIYTHRIDYYLSGDRLAQELKKLDDENE